MVRLLRWAKKIEFIPGHADNSITITRVDWNLARIGWNLIKFRHP